RQVPGAVVLFFGMIAGLGTPACSSKPKPPPENPAAGHLRKICQAYDLAVLKKRGGAQSAEDLKPFLKQLAKEEDPDALLVSPNDGQPYVIAWGVRLDHETDGAPLLAHEKTGVAGKRY